MTAVISRRQSRTNWFVRLPKCSSRFESLQKNPNQRPEEKEDKINSVFKALRNIWNKQRGITGLETAIVLIAFVVVSSVFAFAALSTGMFSSDKARETITAGLAQTRATMELEGSVIGAADAAAVTGVITTIDFPVTQSDGGADIDLTPGTTVIKYSDETQSKLFASASGFTVTGIGGADTGNLLEPTRSTRSL